MGWLFGKKNKTVKHEIKEPNHEVMEAIRDLQKYGNIVKAHIDWWYNQADDEALSRQLNLYSTGQLKRLESWNEQINEAIQILADNKYSNLQDIYTHDSIVVSMILNKRFINWCYENGKPVDQQFITFSTIYRIFTGDYAIAELASCKEAWKHADEWQTAWTLKTNYHTWMNEYHGFNKVGNYKQNIINELHLEAIITDSMMDCGLNKTNYNKVFQVLQRECRNSFSFNVFLHHENNKYNVYINESLVTGYVKEATAQKLKIEIENIVNKTKESK